MIQAGLLAQASLYDCRLPGPCGTVAFWQFSFAFTAAGPRPNSPLICFGLQRNSEGHGTSLIARIFICMPNFIAIAEKVNTYL